MITSCKSYWKTFNNYCEILHLVEACVEFQAFRNRQLN